MPSDQPTCLHVNVKISIMPAVLLHFLLKPLDALPTQQIRMDGEMLTEDIDSSFRASLLPVKICYCYQARNPRLPLVI